MNDISNNNDTDRAFYEPNYPSFSLSGQQKSFSYLSDDIYSALILEEVEKIYNKLTTELTNWSIAATATIKESSLPLPSNNNTQKYIHGNDNAYDETKGSRYLNQKELYDNDQEQLNEI